MSTVYLSSSAEFTRGPGTVTQRKGSHEICWTDQLHSLYFATRGATGPRNRLHTGLQPGTIIMLTVSLSLSCVFLPSLPSSEPLEHLLHCRIAQLPVMLERVWNGNGHLTRSLGFPFNTEIRAGPDCKLIRPISRGLGKPYLTFLQHSLLLCSALLSSSRWRVLDSK